MQSIVRINFREYLRLMFNLTYRRPMMIVIVVFDFLMVSWIAVYYFHLMKVPHPVYSQFFTVFLITVAQPLVILITLKRNYKLSAQLNEALEINFTPEEIQIRGNSFYSEYSWEKTFKVLELNDWFLVYQNNLHATIIPKNSFVDFSTDDFRRFLRSIDGLKSKLLG